MTFHQTLKTGALAAALAALTFAPANAQTTLNLGYSLAPTSHYGVGATAMAEELARLSDGQFVIEQFPSNALGGEREMVEGAQLGTVDLVITSTGPVGNFVPAVLVTDIPFLFRDYEHAHAVLDGEIGQALLDEFPNHGLIALAWGENGFRNLTNAVRPIRTPEDTRGLKVRTMENQVHMRAFQELGVLPTPMAFPELFTALQQGTVDGQENPIGVILSANFSQVQQHLSLTQHVYSPALILMSPMVYDGLSEEEQGWFREAARVGAQAMRQKVREDAENGIAMLRTQGMEVVEDVDRAAFEAALAPVFAEFAQRFGQDRIDAIVNYGQ